jgi:hypothetical protein
MRERFLSAYAMTMTTRRAYKRVILGVTASAIIDARKRRVLDSADEKWEWCGDWLRVPYGPGTGRCCVVRGTIGYGT